MAYQALYRKFRPEKFEDVKGQDAIVATLKNQIRADRIGHAYLFCGTRGTGKTTIAKIFAKSVNCEHPVDGSPCGECALCKAITQQTSMNVIEIDAASNNGVDNIREIVDEVQYSPTEGKYKVYIIDEVHMLSTGAFNALLKTLEEPPSYVIFILATTEVHKIPVTILSRCQRYDFKRISIDIIAERLKELLVKEGVEAEEKAVRYIAKSADGALRDGLSLLDQCIAFYMGETLTYDKVLDVLGAVDTEVFNRLFLYIVGDQVVSVLEMLEELVMEGRDLPQFISDFTWYLRNMLLIKTSDQAADMIDASGEQLALYQQYAARIDTDTLMRYIRILSETSNQIRYAAQKRILIELSLIKMLRPEMETDYGSILQRIRKLEEKLSNGLLVRPGEEKDSAGREALACAEADGAGIKKATEISGDEAMSDNSRLLEAIPEDLKEAAQNWPAILGRLPVAMQSMMNSARPVMGEGNELLLVFTDELEKNYIEKEEHISEIEAAIRGRIHKEVKVRTQYVNEGRDTDEVFVDLRKIVKMEVEYVD